MASDFSFFGGTTLSAEDKKLQDIVNSGNKGVTFAFDHISELKKREQVQERGPQPMHRIDEMPNYPPYQNQNSMALPMGHMVNMSHQASPVQPQHSVMTCPVPSLSCPVYTINGVQYANVPQNMWYGGYNGHGQHMPMALVHIRPVEMCGGNSGGPLPPPGFGAFNQNMNAGNTSSPINPGFDADSHRSGNPQESSITDSYLTPSCNSEYINESLERRYPIVNSVGNVTPDILKTNMERNRDGFREEISPQRLQNVHREDIDQMSRTFAQLGLSNIQENVAATINPDRNTTTSLQGASSNSQFMNPGFSPMHGVVSSQFVRTQNPPGFPPATVMHRKSPEAPPGHYVASGNSSQNFINHSQKFTNHPSSY